MSINIALIVVSVIYSVFLNIIFYIKKTVSNTETRLFSWLVSTNLAGLIVELICFYTIEHPKYHMIGYFSNRLLLVYYLNFIFLMTLYVFSISYSGTKEDTQEYKLKYKKNRLYASVIYVLSIITSLILPFSVRNDALVTYSYGPAIDFVYLVSTVAIFLWIFTIIKNNEKIKVNKYIPLFLFIFLGIVVALLQRINPALTLMTVAQTFIVFWMFFTIENPDMKLINEITLARTQAERANEAKTDFLSNMSHEIRTPLNAIVGFSQLLKRQDVSKELQEDVNNIISSSENLLEIVNGILDISKIEANKLEIINIQYNFEKVVAEVVALAKARLGEKDLQFVVKVDPSVPKYLYGDYVRLKQIMINLLTNSIKYTKKGKFELRIDSVIKDDICRLIIVVEDTGVGIKPQQIDKLFQKFERIDVKKHITTEGTGLGLAITKKLVELMNGEIVVQSEYGEGSKFTVAVDQKIAKYIQDRDYETHTDEIFSLDGSNKKVLVVDDNLVNLKVISKLLKTYLITVEEVSSGTECLRLIEEGNKYDLILLDDMMPIMNGVSTLKKLKQIKGFKTPVVMLTANAISGMREKYLKDGFDDYIPKPISQKDLYKVLKRLLFLE